ncbi:MAG: LD-carboxypeptidase [Armatimonadota bacterium]|jgi:muramoyltetrapeptide carboxypeptidase
MRKPKALKPGDTLAIISPASPLTQEQNEKGLKFLRDQGYITRIFPHCYDADGFLAGSDKDRAKDLVSAFLDSSIDGIYCSRGGYGCSRLIPYLDFDLLVEHPKQLIGFSDLTVIHAALNQRGLPTLHAPMALTLNTPREPWVYESLFAAMKGENPIPNSAPTGKTLVPGKATGELVGGCLILIADLIGTDEQINMDGKIVLIEDVDEMPHRIDAKLTQLINGGCIQNAAGILIGEMTRTDERADPLIGMKPWREIIRERLAPLKIPTVYDFPCGHAKQMLSLPLGVSVTLDADSGTLAYNESHCQL